MSVFEQSRSALEEEGVYIGGWSVRNVLTPAKKDGKHESRVDHIQAISALDSDWSYEEEKALLRKLDMRVLSPCFVIFWLAYLDRGNIGSIRILQHGGPDSLEESLHLEGTDFNWAVSATYFVMTAMILPSILALKKTSAKVFFPVAMVTWGAIVACMAATTNTAGLIAARFFLGVPESGIGPAVAFYFSFWYLPKERAFRLGILFSANALGVASSNLLALAIDNLNGKGRLTSWQWAFLLEGLLPIVLAVPICFTLLSFPETDKSLSERERHIAINRFGRGSTRKTDVTWSTPAFFRIITRPSTYVFFLSYVCTFMMISAQSNFLPTILLDFLGFSSLKANLYGAATAFVQIPFFWLLPWHSDWTRERMWHYLVPLLASVPGYAVWTWASGHAHQTAINPISLYGMAFLAQLPIIAQPILVAYRTSTLYGATEQAVGTGVTFAAMSIASIIAPQMYPNSDAPLYHTAFSATCGLLTTAVISYTSLPYWLLREARARKMKTGHAMPIRAMEDAERSQVTDVARQRMHDMNEQEEFKSLEVDQLKGASARHIELQAESKV